MRHLIPFTKDQISIIETSLEASLKYADSEYISEVDAILKERLPVEDSKITFDLKDKVANITIPEDILLADGLLLIAGSSSRISKIRKEEAAALCACRRTNPNIRKGTEMMIT